MADFTANQRDLRRKADLNRSYVRSRSAPKMETVHSRDEIRRDLSRFREINKYKGRKLAFSLTFYTNFSLPTLLGCCSVHFKDSYGKEPIFYKVLLTAQTILHSLRVNLHSS